MSTKIKKVIVITATVILSLGLAISIGFNIYLEELKMKSYLQQSEQFYIMETGILDKNLEFNDGAYHKFSYDFDSDLYLTLKTTYGLEKIAGGGSEFERAKNLMANFAPRLTHKGDFKNSLEHNSLSLLEYSLDNKKQGINCRAKAQILNEMCLSLGIYARKVWLMPYSSYDTDCHVVNEVWDTSLNKWVMLDITNNSYWVDQNKTPLSVLEIRQMGAKQEFCTPVKPGDSLNNLQSLHDKYIDNVLYIMKNVVYTQYLNSYGVGETTPVWWLVPKNLNLTDEYIISLNSVTKSPIE